MACFAHLILVQIVFYTASVGKKPPGVQGEKGHCKPDNIRIFLNIVEVSTVGSCTFIFVGKHSLGLKSKHWFVISKASNEEQHRNSGISAARIPRSIWRENRTPSQS